MPLRDVLLFFVVFSALPVILYRPYIGIFLWTWLSLMSPHRLSWGIAYDFPFVKIVGAVTIVAAFVAGAPKRLPLTRESFVLFLFILWTVPTTVFALEQDDAWTQADKVWKIQLIVFLTMALVISRRQLNIFVALNALSVGFYGVKGGIFTISSGGASHVMGPEGSFIHGNNGLGLALVMVIPLMRYLQSTTSNPWVRLALFGSMVLVAIAVLGTQSRGAMLGLVATMGFLFLKGKGKILLGALGIVMLLATFTVMPDKWFDRMDSIRNYEQDTSATGRLNAWATAFNLALDRPFVGGGFNCFGRRTFAKYAPDPTRPIDVHSIYFEVLGEHGWVGLILFLTLAGLMWRSCSQIHRQTARHEELAWLSELARMIQVSMIGFAVAGAFVGLAYFDLYYNLVAIVVVAKFILKEELTAKETEPRTAWSKAPSPLRKPSRAF